MNILITGATGFIGRHLCTTLTHDGHYVTALMRSPDQLARLQRFVDSHGGDGFRIAAIEGDLDRAGLGVASLPEQIDAVVHLAARFGWHLPAEVARKTNVDGSLEVARLASQLGCRLVLVSGFMLANEGYLAKLGIHDDGVNGTDWSGVYRRVGGYEASKLEAAMAVRQFAREHRLDLVEVQPATVVGHSRTGDLEPSQPFFSLMENLNKGRMAMVPGSPDHWLPLVPVDYLGAVLAAACTESAVPQRLLALDPATPALQGLLGLLATSLGCKAPKRHLALPLMRALLRIPGLADRLNVAPESLEFIGTTRFDTSPTEAFLNRIGVTRPDLVATLQASARGYRQLATP